MDWKQIQEQYPKCIKLLSKGSHSGVWVLKYMSDARLLYDFFDKQGIYISINVNMFMMFDWSIITTPDFSISIQSDFDFSIRSEAEQDAFLKAFIILECTLERRAQ